MQSKRMLQKDVMHMKEKNLKTDIVIIGCGVGGLYCALHLPQDKQIVMVSKDAFERSDSFLAQGGICVLRDEEDYDSYYEDTMKAGHYENNPRSVELMIRSSQKVIEELVGYGVDFEKDENGFVYTREGAHSRPRILFHEDETGKEITSNLLAVVKERPNVTLIEHYTMVDLLTKDNTCYGILGKDADGEYSTITADYTVLATGGIGGLYEHSTNFRHLTGDALAVALRHNVKLQDIDYIQIHPTTLYQTKPGRKFLISESVRGEGAILLNSKGERFVDELLPRDVVTQAILREMRKEGTKHVWLSLAPIPEEEIKSHFPNIYKHCLEEGYDITKEPIPVVPAQHYFMGGVAVDEYSKTSMERLYAVGETACNGVHGKNRLASNSLLESLVFAERAAGQMTVQYEQADEACVNEVLAKVNGTDETAYAGYEAKYKEAVLTAIEKEKEYHEQYQYVVECR